MAMQTEQVTAVQIHNKTYHIRCQDPQRVERLARYLDERMKEVAAQTSTVDSLKVAVLAALNIVDGYFAAEERLDSLQKEVSARSEKMIEALERFQPS